MSSRMEADDFFNAYLVLKENDQAAMGKLAKLAGKPLVSATAYGTFPTMGVTVVCLAFSVELYIKDVYFALKIKPPRSHNILKLFEGLPEEIKQKIFSHEEICQNPFHTSGTILSVNRFSKAYTPYDGFIDQLKAISEGFERWRYSYESGTLQYNESFALAFIKSVRSVANTIRTLSAA